MRSLKLILAGAALAACARTGDQSADSTARKARPAADTAMPMSEMPARAVGGGAMVDQMRVHLQTMRAMTAESLRAGLPMHREMVDGMLAQMTREMMEMKMPADARWSALMDSVHQDLNVMRGMSGTALANTMAAHGTRLTRLIEMHHSMLARSPSSR